MLSTVSRGATRMFAMGGGAIIFFMYTQWLVGCEKSIIRKLYIMLQASSVLPHSKKLQKQTDFKDTNHVPNLTEEILKI